jgi:proteasome lid subunit RPN8/RPN11
MLIQFDAELSKKSDLEWLIISYNVGKSHSIGSENLDSDRLPVPNIKEVFW